MQAHNQWANRPADERFKSLEELKNAVNGRRMRSRAQNYDLSTMEIYPEDKGIILKSGNLTAEPSNWAFGQLAAQVKAPANYLRSLPAELAVKNIRHGLETITDKREVKLMSLANDEGSILQAVTSPTYGRIWDADVVDMGMRIVEKTGGRFYNPKAYSLVDGKARIGQGAPEPSGLYASDRDVFMFLIDGGSMFDIGPRAQINRGFFMWNSEVGSKTFGLTTFLFNMVCGNHFVWGATDVTTMKIIHRSGAPNRFDTEAAPALLSYVNASAAPIEAAVRKAIDYLIPMKSEKRTFEDVQEFVTKYGKFTKAEVRGAYDCANREEGDCATLWQIAQGLTAFARDFEYIDARVDLETRAGRLLDLVK